MSKAKLKDKLAQLRLRATETTRLTESSRQHLYRTLSEAYLYWRDCQQEPDFLEKEYKKANIQSRELGDNKINFRPFVKLVFGLSSTAGYANNKASQWATVMRKLDELYTASPIRYEENGEGRLALDIASLGGITNIILEDKEENYPPDEVKLPAKKIKDIIGAKLSDDELAQRGRILLSGKSAAAIGVANPTASIRADGDSFVGLIGRRETDGTITLLGSTNDAEAINALAKHATKRNYYLLPKNLRQIAEVLSVPLFPYGSKPKSKEAERAWEQRIYYDQLGKYIVKGKKAGDKDTKVPIGTPRRLLIRGKQKDIIYSNMRMDCCVVIRCEPVVSLASKSMNIYLKTEERKHIDNAISNGELELMTAIPNSKLNPVTGALHDFTLQISNQFNSRSHILHFYEQGRANNSATTNHQGDFNWAAFKATWKTKIDINWLVKLRAEFLDEWFSKLGKTTQIARDNNYVFTLEFTEKKLITKFNIGKTGGSASRPFDLVTSLPKGEKSLSLSLRSKDIGPILYNLADTAVTGSINISGNEQAVLVEFKTDMGRYQIAIPTASEYKRKKADKSHSLFQKGA